MPIYEFHCSKCNTIFNFFSRTVNTKKIPDCPKCGTVKLSRQVSRFAVVGRASDTGDEDFPVDESKMEKAMEFMAREAEGINEDDPRQAARLMRRLSEMTGMELNQGMEEALRRMERGEDPDQIEAEMGDLIGDEDPFVFSGKKGGRAGGKPRPPRRDERLYDL